MMSLPQHRVKRIKTLPSMIHNQSFQQRQWLKRRGKGDMLRFSDQMIKKLQIYFQSLDQNGNSTISADQLEDPLILFGVCKNKAEVRSIFQAIDFDNSGELQFNEFLQVFRRVKASNIQSKLCKKPKQSKMYQQFTSNIDDKIGTLLGMKNKIKNEIPFRLGMSIYRRKHLMNAIISNNPSAKQVGKSVMNKFQSQIKESPTLKQKLIKNDRSFIEKLPQLPRRKSVQFTYHKRIKTTNN